MPSRGARAFHPHRVTSCLPTFALALKRECNTGVNGGVGWIHEFSRMFSVSSQTLKSLIGQKELVFRSVSGPPPALRSPVFSHCFHQNSDLEVNEYSSGVGRGNGCSSLVPHGGTETLKLRPEAPSRLISGPVLELRRTGKDGSSERKTLQMIHTHLLPDQTDPSPPFFLLIFCLNSSIRPPSVFFLHPGLPAQ